MSMWQWLSATLSPPGSVISKPSTGDASSDPAAPLRYRPASVFSLGQQGASAPPEVVSDQGPLAIMIERDVGELHWIGRPELTPVFLEGRGREHHGADPCAVRKKDV